MTPHPDRIFDAISRKGRGEPSALTYGSA